MTSRFILKKIFSKCLNTADLSFAQEAFSRQKRREKNLDLGK